MRCDKQGKAYTRITLAVAALVLGGCVSDTYLYDDAPGVYYRGSAGYPPYYFYGYPGHYGYPRYYAPPGYYGYSPYPPRVVYHDHDHRGDDRDRHDRNGRDHPPQDRDGRADGRPPGKGPAMPPPQWRNPPRGVTPEDTGSPPQAQPATDDRCAGAKCRPSAAPRSGPQQRGTRASRVPQPAGPDDKPEARKEPD